jgi:hypothetical protein
MPANGLLMIAPVWPGKEKSLADTLNVIGNDITGRRTPNDVPWIDFPGCSSIHFARLALFPDPVAGTGRARLLLATDFDGTLHEHLRELFARTRQPDRIWGRLVGYDGPDQFIPFVENHQVPPEAYYRAFPDVSLGTMRDAIALESAFHARLTAPNPAEVCPSLPDALRIVQAGARVRDWLKRPFIVIPRALLAAGEVLGLMARHGIRAVFTAALRINATLNRVGWIRLSNILFFNQPQGRPHSFSQADPCWRAQPVPAGYPPEDAVLQNQLTLVTEIAPGQAPRLAAVLALIDLYGRRLSSRGSLVGISTIHTVRWAMIDQDTRLLLVSNYDNTWESYIDEFAEMILSGLDAIWQSAPDYPTAGAQDVAALKQFLRRHQVPANVFYSAVPKRSVLALTKTLEFATWLKLVFRWINPGPATIEGDPSATKPLTATEPGR